MVTSIQELGDDDTRAKSLGYALQSAIEEVDRLVSVFRNNFGNLQVNGETVYDYVGIYPRCDSLYNLQEMVSFIINK